MKYILYFSILLAAVAFISGCGNNRENYNNSQPDAAIVEGESQQAAYDPDKVVTCEMKNKLKEISGIHYLKEDLFVAIQDETGKIFTVNFSNSEISDELIFAGKGDYEDITLDDDFYYVLESTGTIYKVSRNKDAVQTKTFKLPSKKQVEFESLYLDQSGEKLIMICKNCPGKKSNQVKNAYAFNIKTEAFEEEPVFNIDMGTIPASVQNTDPDIKPSAAAIHPLEKKLYVLCSVGKMLLVCDLQGKIEKAWPLNPQVYKQPEGLAFNNSGDLFICNEASDGKGNILKLAYKR